MDYICFFEDRILAHLMRIIDIEPTMKKASNEEPASSVNEASMALSIPSPPVRGVVTKNIRKVISGTDHNAKRHQALNTPSCIRYVNNEKRNTGKIDANVIMMSLKKVASISLHQPSS
jgi:hypothetical protein